MHADTTPPKPESGNMQRIERHSVDEDRVAQALENIRKRADDHCMGLRYGSSGLRAMLSMGRELYEHVAACSVEDPTLESDRVFTQRVLTTAAETCFGVLSLGVFPEGDFDIPLPLVYDRLTNMAYDPDDNVDLDHAIDLAPGPDTWVETFTMGVVSGLIWDSSRVLGLLLRKDYAPEIRAGLSFSQLNPTLDPADTAQMDALCVYLNEASQQDPP
ncbi:hypothetical protein [Nocardiopsis alba]|uniref:hypothetical protein n=2 Tax=Nocardiopsis alba TaxID=53437 RepID=UPI00366F5918